MRAQKVICTATTPLTESEMASIARAEEARLAMEGALSAYVNDMYPGGLITVYGHVEPADDSELAEESSAPSENVVIIACYAHRAANLPNYWAGAVRSRWAVSFSASGQSQPRKVHVVGEAEAQAHYFEDGNVQLATTPRWETSLTLNGGNGAAYAALADDLVAAIRKVRSSRHPTRLAHSSRPAPTNAAGGGRVARGPGALLSVHERYGREGVPCPVAPRSAPSPALTRVLALNTCAGPPPAVADDQNQV